MTQEIKHLSERPWSDYTASDYSIEQWHASCLIHQHEGPPTSKSQCKLPVKTPNGAVNKNAIHSAAAALAGARGGVHASSTEKSSAAKALIRYYHQMDEKPPPSLLKHSIIQDFIDHAGVKGMKWGVRKTASKASKGKTSSDFKKTVPHRGKKPSQLTNKQLKDVNARINLEQNYQRLNPTKIQKGAKIAKGLMAVAGTAITVYGMYHSPAAKSAISKGKQVLAQQRLAGRLLAEARRTKQLSLPGL
jgi:hypothetical protein